MYRPEVTSRTLGGSRMVARLGGVRSLTVSIKGVSVRDEQQVTLVAAARSREQQEPQA